MQIRLSTDDARQKRILAVHDISCVGRCSITVALPMLSAMGFETSILPTSILSTHTGGFTGYTYHDLIDDVDAIVDHWKGLGMRFDAIYTGWLGSHHHIQRIQRLMDLFEDSQPRIIIDPVMGDNGRLYATLDQDYVAAMREYCKRAQILLPNLTEACLLTDAPYPTEGYSRDYIGQMLVRLTDIGPETVVLTGVSLTPDRIGAATYNRTTGHLGYFDGEFIPGSWHGSGDVFASAFLGTHLNGASVNDAIQTAVNFTTQCIRRTKAAGTDERLGLQFEPELVKLAMAARKNDE